jgi:PAS domain S-box-containing protein
MASRDALWRILLVDDNALDRAQAKAALINGSLRRYRFTEASTVAQTVALCAALPPFDCVVLDFELTDGNALDVLGALARDANHLLLTPVVIVTGDASGETSRAALRAGAQDHLGKAWLGAESLTRAVENAVERHAMSREINALRGRQQLIADCARVGSGGVEAGDAVAQASPLDMFKRIGPLVGAEIQIHCVNAASGASGSDPALHPQTIVGLNAEEQSRLSHADDGENLSALAYRAKRPIYRSKLQSSDDALVRGLRDIGVQVCVCCPVLVERQAVGTMSFASRRRDHFTLDELDFIERMVMQVALSQERLRGQLQLRESQAFNSSLLDGSTDCVKVLDGEGRLQHINEHGRMKLELQAHESLKNRLWVEFWPFEIRPRAHAAVHAALLGNSSNFEGPCETSKGTLKWWDVSVSPIRDTNTHTVSRLLVISRDITARRADAQALQISRESLRASESELRHLTDNAPDVMFRFDPQLRYVFVNAAITRATGLLPEQVIGKTNRELGMPAENVDQWERALNQVFDTGLTLELAFAFDTPTGTRHYTSRLLAQLAPDFSVSHVLGVAHDTTQQRELQIQREQLLEAERAARMEGERLAIVKDEFLATLSHELRTPLAAIVGWAGVLKRSLNDTDVVRRGVDAIARNGAAQSRLIGELLDMNRIVSGKLKIELELVDAALVCTSAIDSLRPTAEAKGVSLVLAMEPHHSQLVFGDALRLQQVLANLLNNAVKFTPSGGTVTLALQALPGAAVQLCVSDTGKGMAASFMPFLFDRFSQADGSASRANGGLGLGLSIVKHLVELHGGSVMGHSDGEGRGAVFTVTLPAAQPGLQPAPQALPATSPTASSEAPWAARWTSVSANEFEPVQALSGLTILLVDDQEDVRELCRRLLLEFGAQVQTASSANVALLSLQQRMPDVLISDIGMPEMDGYQLMRRIRNDLQLNPQRLPAVALSAFTRPVDHARALQAGYCTCVDKPIAPNLLLRAVLEVKPLARMVVAHSPAQFADTRCAPPPTAKEAGTA